MRPIGVVASGSRSFYAPVLVYKEAEPVLREECLAAVKDRVSGRLYLGVLRWLSKIDPLLPATQRSGIVDNPKLAEVATNIPFETSYIKILGEISGGNMMPPSDPPTPRSEVLVIESPEDLNLYVGDGLVVGEHKYSGIRIPMDPKYLPYHVGIVGATGTGKSRLVKALVDEVLSKTDWKVIIFDHSGVDYVSFYPQSVVDSLLVMPDPVTLGELISEASMLEKQVDYVATSIYAYIASIKKGRAEVEGLAKFAQQKKERVPKPADCSLEYAKDFNFTNVEKLMMEIKWDLGFLRTCVEDVSGKLGARDETVAKMVLLLETYSRKIIESLNIKKLTARDILDKAWRERIVTVDLSNVDLRVRRYIVRSVITELWKVVEEYREKPRTLLVVDEAHNYACRDCGTSLAAIERTAREGRKWELGLVLASQRMIDFSTDVRNNINTFFFSRLQTPGDFDNLKGVLDLGGIGSDTLSILGVREFFFAGLGNPLRFPILLKVRDVGEPLVAGRAS